MRPASVIEHTKQGIFTYDLVSRMLKERIIMLTGQVEQNMADEITLALLYLESQDPEADITVYIGSPGGSVLAGMQIFDAMQNVKCDVSTICMSQASSMGAFLLAGGTKGKRFALPNSRIMIHQPLGGFQGQASDIQIHAAEILYHKNNLNKHLVEFTGQPLEVIERDTDRDYFMSSFQAKEYGIIDEIVGNDVLQRALSL